MKKYCLFVVSLSIYSLLLLSCSKERNSSPENENGISPHNRTQEGLTEQKLKLKVSSLSLKEITKIGRKFATKKENNRTNGRFTDPLDEIPIDENTPIITDEQEIRTIISPLVGNGRSIYNNLLATAINSPEWQFETEADKQAMLNFTHDSQFCDLALIYSTTQTTAPEAIPIARINSDIIKDCVSTAIGVGAIRELVSNTAALMTVQGTIKILKTIGKRYLSYIGIAWMIWDFVDCVSHF